MASLVMYLNAILVAALVASRFAPTSHSDTATRLTFRTILLINPSWLLPVVLVSFAFLSWREGGTRSRMYCKLLGTLMTVWIMAGVWALPYYFAVSPTAATAADLALLSHVVQQVKQLDLGSPMALDLPNLKRHTAASACSFLQIFTALSSTDELVGSGVGAEVSEDLSDEEIWSFLAGCPVGTRFVKPRVESGTGKEDARRIWTVIRGLARTYATLDILTNRDSDDRDRLLRAGSAAESASTSLVANSVTLTSLMRGQSLAVSNYQLRTLSPLGCYIRSLFKVPGLAFIYLSPDRTGAGWRGLVAEVSSIAMAYHTSFAKLKRDREETVKAVNVASSLASPAVTRTDPSLPIMLYAAGNVTVRLSGGIVQRLAPAVTDVRNIVMVHELGKHKVSSSRGTKVEPQAMAMRKWRGDGQMVVVNQDLVEKLGQRLREMRMRVPKLDGNPGA